MGFLVRQKVQLFKTPKLIKYINKHTHVPRNLITAHPAETKVNQIELIEDMQKTSEKRLMMLVIDGLCRCAMDRYGSSNH